MRRDVKFRPVIAGLEPRLCLSDTTPPPILAPAYDIGITPFVTYPDPGESAATIALRMASDMTNLSPATVAAKLIYNPFAYTPTGYAWYNGPLGYAQSPSPTTPTPAPTDPGAVPTIPAPTIGP